MEIKFITMNTTFLTGLQYYFKFGAIGVVVCFFYFLHFYDEIGLNIKLFKYSRRFKIDISKCNLKIKIPITRRTQAAEANRRISHKLNEY